MHDQNILMILHFPFFLFTLINSFFIRNSADYNIKCIVRMRVYSSKCCIILRYGLLRMNCFFRMFFAKRVIFKQPFCKFYSAFIAELTEL